jgi:hypothetical protein
MKPSTFCSCMEIQSAPVEVVSKNIVLRGLGEEIEITRFILNGCGHTVRRVGVESWSIVIGLCLQT